MTTDIDLETQIGQWRSHIQRHNAISAVDVDEMEDHLRERIDDLTAAGLSDDEAFLVAVKRIGSVDELSREFAREHSDRLWKQLVLMPSEHGADAGRGTRDLVLMLILAFGAAIAVTATVAGTSGTEVGRLVRNLPLLVLPFLTGYFAWKRQLSRTIMLLMVAAYAVAAAILNLYPFPGPDQIGPRGTYPTHTAILAALHAPIALWFVLGLAYGGGRWRSSRRRMDFIRFTGEFIIYYTLLAIGGGVLIGLAVSTFLAIGVDIGGFTIDWILPFTASGAVLVAAWLVEAKQNVVENIAPVLTRVFTPLTTLMLVALMIAIALTGWNLVGVNRDLLILMDLILVLVLGLVLYAISARDPQQPPGVFDRLQLVLIVCALAVDLVMLVAMLSRIAEFGSSPNKIAALGMNLVLLINLVWSVRLLVGFLRGRRTFAALEEWQTRYLPVYGAWAAVVVIVLPPVFGFN